MIFLSGAINATMLANPRPDLGLMIQPGMGNSHAPLPFWQFAADNGCFSPRIPFDPGKWMAWLGTLRPYRDTCLFAVAPDVYRDAEATLARSRPYLWVIEQLGFRRAFVTQNGCRSEFVPWGEFEVLFMGGDDAWKFCRASLDLVSEAQGRGLQVHAGRVNSWDRLLKCAAAGVDSADGTYLKYGPDVNWPKLMDWLDRLNPDIAVELGNIAQPNGRQVRLWEAVS